MLNMCIFLCPPPGNREKLQQKLQIMELFSKTKKYKHGNNMQQAALEHKHKRHRMPGKKVMKLLNISLFHFDGVFQRWLRSCRLHKISLDNVCAARKMELAIAIHLRKAQVWVLRKTFCAQSLTSLCFFLPINSSLYSPNVFVSQTKQAAINPKPYPTSVWGTSPGYPEP